MKRFLSNELGNAKLVTVVGIVGLCWLVVSADQILGSGIPKAVYQAFLMIVALITAFSLGYSIHMRLLGQKPDRQIRKELDARIDEVEKLLVHSVSRAREYEMRMVDYFRGISRRGPDCLGLAKKILRSIERRLYEVKALVATRDKIDLISAYELMNERLELGGSALESLIDQEPYPALESFEWESALEKLFNEIDSELNRAIEMQAQIKKVA